MIITPPLWSKFDNTERVIGTWLDTNYLVYERSFTVTVPTSSIPYATFTAYQLVSGITGVNFIQIKGSFYYKDGSSYGVLTIPYCDSQNACVCCFYGTLNNSIMAVINSTPNVLGQKAELTCWYYK